jgi:hypothetical protein
MILVLAIGAFANDGIVVDTKPSANSCTDVTKNGIVVDTSPIAVVIDAIMGMLVSDKPMAQCTDNSKNGMLVSD